jgi:Ca2+-binding RTX toxin-like protein
LANGSTLYVEEQTSDDDTDVVARIEASDGSVLLDDVVVNHLTNGDQELSDVVVFEDGAGFAIVWSHSVEAYRLDANSGGSISYIQSYDINGTAVGMPYAVDDLYLFGSERDLVALSTELGRTITWFLGTTFSFDVDIEPIAAMTYYGLTTDEGRAVALDTRTIIGWKDVAIQRYLTFELFDGSASDDRLTGTADPDLMNGYAGNDWLNGLGGDDYINGAIGSDTLIGGAGNDTIKAGPDVLDLRDFVYAGAGDDSVMGGAGNDLIYGDAGDDTLEGQIGADQLVGGDGDDMLTGEALSDALFGGDGIDFLNGGYGYDRLNGGDGADRFYHNGSAVFGSDWVQDYDSTEGDVLLLLPGYDAEDFHINYAETSGAGEAGVREAFVIYEATGQIIWALVDGEAQSEILLQIGGTVTDLVLS